MGVGAGRPLPKAPYLWPHCWSWARAAPPLPFHTDFAVPGIVGQLRSLGTAAAEKGKGRPD